MGVAPLINDYPSAKVPGLKRRQHLFCSLCSFGHLPWLQSMTLGFPSVLRPILGQGIKNPEETLSLSCCLCHTGGHSASYSSYLLSLTMGGSLCRAQEQLTLGTAGKPWPTQDANVLLSLLSKAKSHLTLANTWLKRLLCFQTLNH